MALTPEQIAAFQAAAEEIAAPVVEWLLRDITERVKLAGEMTSTAAYEAYRAQALGESKKALKAYLKKQLQVSEKEAQALLEAAARFAQEDDYARVGVWAMEADGASLARLTAAAVKQAGEQLENLTGTLGMTSPRTGQPLPLQKVYRECMDDALKLVSTGAATASEAARQATRQLAGRGVVSIDYASGVSTELGAAVRRNLMGGMGQLVEQVTQMDHDELGCNGWEISAHANSAPDHEPFQGRQYSDAEFKRLNESLARRIGTLNCGHVAMPVILGVDSPQYTQSELDAFREENAQGVTWEGRHMTGYEATQYQNRIERGIRRQEHRVLMSEAAGDEEQLLHDRVKLTRLNQEYARFNKAMGFKSRAERLEVVGWSSSRTTQKQVGSIKNNPQRFREIDFEDKPVTKESIARIKPVSSQLLDATGQKRLAIIHKNLLMAVYKAPIGTEYGECYNLNMERLTPRPRVGEKLGRIRLPDFDEPYIAVHNHPNGQTFSVGDIQRVLERPNLKMLTAVGNNGQVYAMEKASVFSLEPLKAMIDELKEQHPDYVQNGDIHLQLVETFFERAKRYGLHLYTSSD